MGIFNFFRFFENTFRDNIYRVKSSIKSEVYIDVDNLMIDMNGLFHTSAQKIFRYGSFASSSFVVKNDKRNQERVFRDVCASIEKLLLLVNPTKRVILCVDGSAPIAKQIQQSKRRYVSSLKRSVDDETFDSNCISPGTEFMDRMNGYIIRFIRSRMNENPYWQNLEIVFSSDKVEAEGEHKIQSYVRKFGKPEETFMIHGSDADLIMLSLISHKKFYVLRDDRDMKEYLLLDMPVIRPKIIEMMRWKEKKDYQGLITYKFSEEWAINDFVFLCFMVGNDFLAHVPALEIVEGGIDVLIDTYKQVCEEGEIGSGHLTRSKDGKIIFSTKNLCRFFEIISEYEKELLERKMMNREKYFPDQTLIDSVVFRKETNNYDVDIDKYRTIYCEKHFGKSMDDMDAVCHEYLDGLRWVLLYYTSGVPEWSWYFPYHYTPPAKALCKSFETFSGRVFRINKPLLPFVQLMCILPVKSKNLLPDALGEHLELLKNEKDEVEIDYSGKRYEYQGIVLLPFMDVKNVMKVYKKYYADVSDEDKRRNYLGKTMVFRYTTKVETMYLIL